MIHDRRRHSGTSWLPFLLLVGGVFAFVRLRAKHSPEATARREAEEANRDLQQNMRKALAMKKAAEAEAHRPEESRTGNEGMRNLPNRDIAPSGALEAEGFRPAFGRGGMAR